MKQVFKLLGTIATTVALLIGSASAGNLTVNGNFTVNSNTFLATVSGNVGIGTSSPGGNGKLVIDPGSGLVNPLDFKSASNDEWAMGPNVGPGSGFGIYDYTVGATRLKLDLNGNVGIGTTSPGYPLDVDGTINSTYSQITAGSPTLAFYSPFNEEFQLKQEGTSVNGASKFSVIEAANGTRYLMSILWNGNVGIGTTSPTRALEVHSSAGDAEIGVQSGDSGGILWTIQSSNNNGGNSIFQIIDRTHNVSYLQIDQSAGTVNVPVLKITGGSDVAEPFKITTKGIPKGALVVIDEANPGHLKLSEHAYDTHVAGILSGANGINPGLSLSQQGALEGGENVALSGRVYALADASNGPINPGDLLTTSDTPGHCMRVTDHAKAQGAIIGKAMNSLESGQGFVLVLVTLQ